jgi:hypothetical protein
VLILKVVKVICFDTLLQVFILNRLEKGRLGHPPRERAIRAVADRRATAEVWGDRIKNESRK